MVNKIINERKCCAVLTLALLTLAGCLHGNGKIPVETVTVSDYIFTETSAGPFRLGDPLPGASSTCPYEVKKMSRTRMVEGTFEETVYWVYEDGELLMEILPSYDHKIERYVDLIGEIMIISERFRTEEGIGVSSTIGEFLSSYPEYRLWYTYVSDRYVIQPEGSSFQFLLCGQDFSGFPDSSGDMTEMDISGFKEDAAVQSIRLFRLTCE